MRELSNDPWTWTDLSPDEIRSLSERGDGPNSPLFQWDAVYQCNGLRPLIDADKPESGCAVLEAVYHCAMRGLVMPDWLVSAYLKRYRAVTEFKTASWDSPLSFGPPYPKGTNLAAKRKRRMFRIRVHNSVVSILQAEPETPIDKSLFERVGRPFGLGATLTEEYYYSFKRFLSVYMGSPSPADALLIPFCVSGATHAPTPAKNRKLAGRQKRRG